MEKTDFDNEWIKFLSLICTFIFSEFKKKSMCAFFTLCRAYGCQVICRININASIRGHGHISFYMFFLHFFMSEFEGENQAYVVVVGSSLVKGLMLLNIIFIHKKITFKI